MTKILDYKKRGKVGQVLKKHIENGTKLSIASSVFTIFAFNQLKNELKNIDQLKFLFTEPIFIKEFEDANEDNIEKINLISGNKYEIKFKNKMKQFLTTTISITYSAVLKQSVIR